MIRKILFATDFSPLSRVALTYAAGLARFTGAKLIGVHVVHLPVTYRYVAPRDDASLTALEVASRQRLKTFFRKPELIGLEVETRQTRGLPEDALNRIAREEGVDLVVVARHGRSVIERFLIGSTTEKILRETGFPLLVLPEAPPRSAALKRILCATDFSPSSKYAVRFAARLAVDYGVEVTFLHVIHQGSGDPQGDALGSKTIEKLKGELEELVAIHGAPSNSRKRILLGQPYRVILEESRRSESDVVVVGIRGHSLQEGKGTGSTTTAVLRSLVCPLLVVPPGV